MLGTNDRGTILVVISAICAGITLIFMHRAFTPPDGMHDIELSSESLYTHSDAFLGKEEGNLSMDLMYKIEEEHLYISRYHVSDRMGFGVDLVSMVDCENMEWLVLINESQDISVPPWYLSFSKVYSPNVEFIRKVANNDKGLEEALRFSGVTTWGHIDNDDFHAIHIKATITEAPKCFVSEPLINLK